VTDVRDLLSPRGQLGVQALGSRCLWCLPEIFLSKAPPAPLSGKELERFAVHFGKCMERARIPTVMRFSSGAAKLWSERYASLGQEHESRVIATRVREQTIRVSMNYAMLDNAAEIDVPHLQAGLSVVAYSQACEEAILGEGAEDTVANIILSALTASPLSQTELYALFSGHKLKPQIMGALAGLVDKGWVGSEKRKTLGRPETIWNRIPEAKE